MKKIRKSQFIFNEYTWYEKLLMRVGWYRFENFVENWVYPGYYLRNCLFHPYNTIKLPEVLPYEMIETEYQMFLANMNLIVNFMEKAHPERLQWYKDNDWEGPRYGDKPYDLVVMPEYRNKYIMDIIKEIYHWYKETYPKLIKDKEYLDKFCADYLIGDTYFEGIPGKKDMFEIKHNNSHCPKTVEELEKYDVDWDIINRYFFSHIHLLNIKWVRFITLKLSNDIELQKQKYLYLCVAVRPYLFT